MAEPEKKRDKLKKELSLLNVFAIGAGTTLSSGFFLLPGIAAKEAGAAMVLSYLVAAVPLIPAMFCLMELATAMPRAGGAYYFLDRSLGPMVGTIGGIGTWFSLLLKTAFALIGMGAYLNLFFSGDYIVATGVAFALFFGMINLVGAKETGSLQTFLVVGILLILGAFVTGGMFHLDAARFEGFFDAGSKSILATAGLVYVSFGSVTKVASVAEEVKNPERNLPLGMFLAFGTALLIYVLGMVTIISVVPMDELKMSLTPVADAADYMIGPAGKILVTIAAILAFFSVANAGILSASRYPLAMSRDHLLPKFFRTFNKKELPQNSIVVTVGTIVALIVFLDPTKIAKLASAFQLLVFALCCFAVIIMRESHIEAYDPGYRAPFYPWLQIFGIVMSFVLIGEMGWMPIFFSSGLIFLGFLWYHYYARMRVDRSGAILHVFSRLGQKRHEGLESELRGIMKEKGLRDQDPFDELVAQAEVLDIKGNVRFDEVIRRAAKQISVKVSFPAEKIEKEVMDGTKVGGTPTSHGVAIPHMRLHHIVEPEIILIRAVAGVDVDIGEGFWGEHKPDGPIHAIFFLISPEENPRQHLRILAKIAELVDDERFMGDWLEAHTEQQIKEILLRDERFVHIKLRSGNKTAQMIDRKLRDIDVPEQCLIAIIHRDGKTIVPHGSTVLKDRDRLTIIGDKKGIDAFRQKFI